MWRGVTLLVAGLVLVTAPLAVRTAVTGATVAAAFEVTEPPARAAPGATPRLTPRPAPRPAPAAGAFAFAAHQPGRPGEPVTYPACRPVPLLVNDAHAPRGAAAILAEAVRTVARATGLRLFLAGHTTALPDPAGSGVGAGRLPALVAWTTPSQLPGLAGPVAGLGGSTPRTDRSGHRSYLTGTVALDGPQLAGMLHQAGGRAEVRAVVLHELGHLVGLAHVRDPAELMAASSTQLRFGPGDLRGLARLGGGTCPR